MICGEERGGGCDDSIKDVKGRKVYGLDHRARMRERVITQDRMDEPLGQLAAVQLRSCATGRSLEWNESLHKDQSPTSIS
jgi:hypothetical protein